MSVESPVGQTRICHQSRDASACNAIFAEALRSDIDDSLPGLLLMSFVVSHSFDLLRLWPVWNYDHNTTV